MRTCLLRKRKKDVCACACVAATWTDGVREGKDKKRDEIPESERFSCGGTFCVYATRVCRDDDDDTHTTMTMAARRSKLFAIYTPETTTIRHL